MSRVSCRTTRFFDTEAASRIFAGLEYGKCERWYSWQDKESGENKGAKARKTPPLSYSNPLVLVVLCVSLTRAKYFNQIFILSIVLLSPNQPGRQIPEMSSRSLFGRDMGSEREERDERAKHKL